MEELLALLVLGGLSILLDKFNKKKARASAKKVDVPEIIQDEATYPPFIQEILGDELITEHTDYSEIHGPPIPEFNLHSDHSLRQESVEPTAYDVSKHSGRKNTNLKLTGSNLKRAILLKEVLDYPRALKPYI